MNTLLKLTLPLGSEIMTAVRLATGGVCSLVGLNVDAVEDCKVCVTESLLLLLHAGHAAAEVEFTADGGLRVAVRGLGAEKAPEKCAEDEISEALLGALAEDVAFEREEGLAAVRFSFGA